MGKMFGSVKRNNFLTIGGIQKNNRLLCEVTNLHSLRTYVLTDVII